MRTVVLSSLSLISLAFYSNCRTRSAFSSLSLLLSDASSALTLEKLLSVSVRKAANFPSKSSFVDFSSCSNLCWKA